MTSKINSELDYEVIMSCRTYFYILRERHGRLMLWLNRSVDQLIMILPYLDPLFHGYIDPWKC